MVALFVIINLVAVFGSPDELPSCGDEEAIETVGEIINDLPLAKQSGAKFVTLNEITQKFFNEEQGKRLCVAQLETTAGYDKLKYAIFWKDQSEGIYHINLEVM